MGIFGNSFTSPFNVPVYEGYGVEVNGDLIALQESYEDQLDTVKAIHAMDMEELRMKADVRQLQESGASDEKITERMQKFEIATESMLNDAWKSIKAFFAKLLGKLRAFFDTVIKFFDGVFRSGESFVKKYEAQLKKLDLTGFEFKMYKYTHLDEPIEDPKVAKKRVEDLLASVSDMAAAAGNASAAEHVRQRVEELKERREDELEELRGALVGGGRLSKEEFKEKLFAYFRNGATGEEDKKEEKVSIDQIIDTLKNTGAKNDALKFIKSVEEEFANLTRKISEIEKKVANAKPSASVTIGDKQNEHEVTYTKESQQLALEAIRTLSGFFSATKEIQMQVFRAWREAWAERNATYKSVAVAAFRYKKA